MKRSKTKTVCIVFLLAAIAIGLFLWWYLSLSQPERCSYLPELVAGETDAEGEPGTAPDWSDGAYVETERRCCSRHGREYVVTDPQPGVYVARFVTEAGVTEVGWLVEAE